MNHLERAQTLRADATTHYNCCQSVLIPFAAEMGLTEDQASALAAHFGSGMRHGSTCGALSGALMVLGALGYDDRQATALLRQFRQTHSATECVNLLKLSKENGVLKKDHCNGLVYEMVEALTQITQES